jgi:hypothetical protein
MSKIPIKENESKHSKEIYRKKLFKEFGVSEKESSLTDIDWEYLSSKNGLSEEFIREFQNNLNWPQISYIQKISEEFICEFQDKVDWGYISFRQILSEDFMKKFTDKVNWDNVSSKQLMSNGFIHENSNKINFIIYFNYQKANFEIIKKYILKTTLTHIRSIRSDHLTEAQKQEIQRILDLKYLFTK